MPDQSVARVPLALARRWQGQALVLYALFLLVLLGASAVAVDYANWLLIDRRLQNVADHASLAGAAMFDDQFVAGSCAGVGQPQCVDARTQAWASVNEDLNLGLSDTDITTLAGSDTPVAGQKAIPSTSAPFAGGHTIWVTTPPPANASYQSVGGRYTLNYAIVFVRVDEPTTTYFGRALGFGARDRVGWATAGPLPTDFALEVFCRNNIPPEHGACGGSGATSLVIDGQGGIRLVRGDIGSNESLKVTATNGQGVIVQAGNVFVVEGSCSNALWTCPDDGTPTQGGISDGTNGKNAFFMPPQPVPQYQSPLWDVTVSDAECIGADATHLCVPSRGAAGALPANPGDWACTMNPLAATISLPLCGRPHDYYSASAPPTSGTVRCDAIQPDDDTYLDGSLHHHMHPVDDVGNAPDFGGHTQGPQDIYLNIADFATPRSADTTPTDWVYSRDGRSGSYRVTLGHGLPPDLGPGTLGVPDPGTLYLRWIPFRTINDGDLDLAAGGNEVTVSIELDELVSGTWVAVTPQATFSNPDAVTLTTGASGPFTERVVQFDASDIQDYAKLSLKITVTTTNSTGANKPNNRGAGISWAELETTHLSPFEPPRIPPGYYHAITVPDGGCAVLDPTATTFTSSTTGLKPFQKAGIYRFGTGSDATIDVGAGSFLIGDGVTLVFNPEFPDPTGGRGIRVGSGGALVLNTMRVPGAPPCTFDVEATTYNPSSIEPSDPDNPLSLLPYSSVCAAWAVDSSSQTGPHAGTMLWTADDPANPGTSLQYCPPDLSLPTQCLGLGRSRYGAEPLPDQYRGITFYFTPDSFPASAISRRFQVSAGGGGCTGNEPGIAFRGVLYAPYDDVIITGGSSFATVGQVLAWTAKFNGACAAIDLDYPYDPAPAPPYLLEPGIGQ